MRHIQASGWVAVGFFALVAGALAQAPVAVVEDVRGKVAGVEFMDYVAAGKLIKLGAKDTLVLGYMKSCWRETITGGTVTVGAEQSTVNGGKVKRDKVACDPGRMQLGSREATQSAATLFRSFQRGQPAATPAQAAQTEPAASAQTTAQTTAQTAAQATAQAMPFTLHGQSPIFEVNQHRGLLLIERLGQISERVEFMVDDKALVRDRFFDLARTQVVLEPGASYVASLGTLKVEFKVDWAALPGPTPVLGRLVRFE